MYFKQLDEGAGELRLLLAKGEQKWREGNNVVRGPGWVWERAKVKDGNDGLADSLGMQPVLSKIQQLVNMRFRTKEYPST